MKAKKYAEKEKILSDLEYEIVTDYVRLRKTGHITQQELADQSKVIRQTISRIENFVTSPQLDTMLKLLESMGYTLKIVPIKDRK